MRELTFWTLLTGSSWVIRIDLALLLLMSLISWQVVFLKWFQFGQALRRAEKDLELLRGEPSLSLVMEIFSRETASPAQAITREGMEEYRRLRRMPPASLPDAVAQMDAVAAAMHREAEAQTGLLYGSLSFLATCVNVAPFLGLFGTIWGLMESFSAIGLEQNASLATVAPGMADALSTTALGLIVAIPAATAYNILLRRMSRVEHTLGLLRRDFVNRLKEHMAESDRPA